jgi:hypothetical protein
VSAVGKMLYGCDFEPIPIVRRIFRTCMQIDAFVLAQPKKSKAALVAALMLSVGSWPEAEVRSRDDDVRFQG